jgi:hypothetical protein
VRQGAGGEGGAAAGGEGGGGADGLGGVGGDARDAVAYKSKRHCNSNSERKSNERKSLDIHALIQTALQVVHTLDTRYSLYIHYYLNPSYTRCTSSLRPHTKRVLRYKGV